MAGLYNIHEVIAPDDTADLSRWTVNQQLTDAIYVGGAGDVSAVAQNGLAVIWKNVPAGTTLPFAARRVNATSTTALNLVACYKV